MRLQEVVDHILQKELDAGKVVKLVIAPERGLIGGKWDRFHFECKLNDGAAGTEYMTVTPA